MSFSCRCLRRDSVSTTSATRTRFRIAPGRRYPCCESCSLSLVVIVAILLVPRLLSRSATPAEGTLAPDFTLPSQDGSTVSLKDYRGKWVVLYFYPKDQTAGCTREAHNFQVDQPKYAERNAVVLGVSVDRCRFAQKVLRERRLELQAARRYRSQSDGVLRIPDQSRSREIRRAAYVSHRS